MIELPLAADGAKVVLIGTALYESEEVPDVPSVARTVEALAELLKLQCEVQEENLTTLLNPRSSDQIGEVLLSAGDSASDALLVYFVGHGFLHNNELYLAHSATIPTSGRVAFSAIPYSAVRDCLLRSAARSLHVVLDCCFAGRAIGTLSTGDFAVERARVEGASVLAAVARDELALAPMNEEFTTFTGAIISYLRAGDPTGPEYLQLRHVFEYLSSRMPAANLPAPRFMANQDADSLVLCRNQSFSQRPNSAKAEGDAEEASVVRQPAPRRVKGRKRSMPGLGEIVSSGTWDDFNPLPSVLMDVDSRVPRTPEHIEELLYDRPPSWEARLFAGTALLELVRLRPSYALHFRGPVTFNGSSQSGQVAFQYIQRKLNDFSGLIEDVNGLVANDRHNVILESEDATLIQSHAHEFAQLLVKYMDFARELRSTAITNRHLRRAANVLAHFSDQPIVSITSFIHRYVSALDESGTRAMDGSDTDINLTIKVDIPGDLSDAFSEALSKY